MSSNERGIFDSDLPTQGMFDPNIFDTELLIPIETTLIPVFVHDNSEITTLTHGNQEITLK